MKRAPAAAAVAALVLNPVVYGLLHWQYGGEDGIAFLNRMAITFGCLILAMIVITLAKPLREPKAMPVRADFDMRPSPLVVWLGGAVIAGVAAFFVVFR